MDVVTGTHHEAHVVLDQEHTEAVARELTEQRAERARLVLVETGGGLVEEQHPRLARERARHLDETGGPGGELVDLLVGDGAQPDAVDELVGDLANVEALP